jgi:hypothetical protein
MPKITVTGTATKIVSANPKRISIVIQNLNTQTVYIGKDSSIIAGQEPFILEQGIFQEDNSGGRMWKGDIYGITSTSTANVVYWERESS